VSFTSFALSPKIEANIDLWPERMTSPREWRVLIAAALVERRELKAEVERLQNQLRGTSR
jgi:hypothetical protein